MSLLKWIAGGLLFSLLLGCGDHRSAEQRYADAMQEAVKTKERTDEIFHGIKFGMRPKEFFDHCTELNKQQLIQEGDDGRMAYFEMADLEKPGRLNFAPKFTPAGDEDNPPVLYALNFSVRYDEWAPWNEDAQSLPLLRDVTRVFMERYGEGFLALPHDKYGRVVTQIKDNRRVTIWREDKQKVHGRFVDLSYAPDDQLVYETVKALPSELLKHAPLEQ
jgi:hypothetical protein